MAAGRLIKRKNKSTSFQTLFDQILCRLEKLYKGSVKSDENILQLLDVLDNCRNKWKSTFIKLYSVLRVQKSEVKRLTNLQAHTQAMFEAEVQKRRRIERSRKSLERKINMIRQVLLVNDVDSARRHLDAIDLSTDEINQSCNEWSVGSPVEHANTPIHSECAVKKGRNSGRISKKLGRASSVSHTGAVRRSATKQELRCASVQKFIVRRSRENLSSKSPQNSAQRLGTINRLNRPHNFVSRTVLRMELCSACGRRITFGKASYKCLVCRLVVHPACRQLLIQTCVPPSVPRANFTPQTSRNLPTPHHVSAYIPISPLTQPQTHGYGDPLLPSPTFANRMRSRNLSLSLLCPSDQFPRVPALVIHCVNEVMARGMKTVGLYRVSGSEKQVRDLYEKFLRSRSTPSLALIEDIHVVCGCLKLFLRSLEEPLVTYLQRPNFVGASEQYSTNPTKAYDCVLNVLKNLPTPNRHTLSFIMLHLKAVSKTPLCQMGEENLAKVFGPTLVGYSCPEPQVMQAISETKPQQDVLRLLFNISDDVYSSFLSDWDNTTEENNEPRTTYFTSLTTDMNSSELTPNSYNNHNNRFCDIGGSTRKGFLPNLLSSFRDMSS